MRPTVCLGLLLFLLSFHGFSAYSDDEVTYVWLARSAADFGTFAMPDDYPFFRKYLVRGGDGGMYGPYPCGWPAFLAPFSSAARGIGERLADDPRAAAVARFRILTLAAPLLGVLLALVASECLVALGRPPRAAWIGALAILFATPGWFYARTLHVENLRTLLSLLAVLAASRGSYRGAVLGGAAAGAAVTLRVDSPLGVPIVALVAFLSADPESDAVRRFGRAAAVLVASIPFWSISLAFNYLRYGTVFGEGRYGALFAPGEYLSSLWVYLLSPGRGLAIYAPLALAGLWYGARARAPLARGLWGLAAAYLLLAGLFRNWVWVWDWGPRYYHIVWWSAGILALASDEFRSRRVPAGTILAVGFLVNATAIPADFVVHSDAIGDTLRIVLDPAAFPPLGQIRSLARGAWDLPLWTSSSWPLGILLAASGVLLTARGLRRPA